MKLLAKAILLVEPVLLAVVVIVYWFAELTQINSSLLIIPLVLLIPPAFARLVVYKRLWVFTPVNICFYLFLALCTIDTYFALSHPFTPPYSWGWYILGRLFMGVILALSITSIAYERGQIDGPLIVLTDDTRDPKAVHLQLNGPLMLILALAVLVGVLGLGGAQYIDKSSIFQPLIERIPPILNFPGAIGGFNSNEIGGAMTFFVPLTLGIALYDWRSRSHRLRALVATVAFLLLALALTLGQSRLAIIGAVVASAIVIWLVVPHSVWRYVALALLLLYCAFEIGVVLGVFEHVASGGASGAPGLSDRDTGELAQRPEIWSAALTLIKQYPLTGYGLNEFRRSEVRNEYVPDFAMVIVPHAHNELLQVGVDVGIPGMILYVIWNIVLIYMIWRTWRVGTPLLKAVAVCAGAAILAHAVFGLADAITMYDRFGFLYWLFAGLVGGAYALACLQPAAKTDLAIYRETDIKQTVNSQTA
ncbi:MAG TPA: O-antigen ligase family protein [Phototrophicaceae bacterium]|nr:O-antigen ligase family protein [Phototrophicaceae bacterium]